MSVKVNLKGLKIIVEELKSKIATNFISNITVINSSDILFAFSFYNQQKLLISLSHNSPFISLVDSSINYKTKLGSLNENLRKYIKGAYITDINLVNDDRIIKFSLTKTNEFYEKEELSLIVELIPTINNLLILDKNNHIKYAKHYSDLSSNRVILKDFEYFPIENKSPLKLLDFDKEKFDKEVEEYLLEIEAKNKRENALPLYNHLLSKKKSLNKKINVLEKEILDAQNKFVFKEIGDILLTIKDNKEELNLYLNDIKDSYDPTKSLQENINHYYEKYKKAKRTIDNDNREILIAKDNIEEINHILNVFTYLCEEEIVSLFEKYLPHKFKSKHKVIPSNSPYYIEVNKTRIGFGKNKEQNNYLTFKLARKNDYFLHTKDSSGSHVVIFSNNPSKDVIQTAAEIALILSNLESGDIYLADVKDVKKADTVGKVNILKYQTIYLNKVEESTKRLLTNQKRF